VSAVRWVRGVATRVLLLCRTIEEASVKVVHCPCGKNVEGETDDALVENVEAHLAADHPDLVGTYSRDQILEMAHEH
jgi:hypothetical protein